MRIALISTEIHGAGGANVTLMPLAGRSVARRQLDLALALGCERIACLAAEHTAEVLDLQQAVEQAGAKFHAITGPRALAGLVGTADEILVMAPGALTDARLLRDTLGERAGILTFPAERAVPVGFERIDGQEAWAGFLIVHGSAAERLFELPGDSDPVSGLLRIALQFGVRRVMLASASLDAGDVALITGPETLAQAERRWLQLSARGESWRKPGIALTSSLARRFAPRVLARPRVPLMADLTSTLFAAGAAVLAWFERPAVGIAVLTLSAAAFVAARTWRAVERGEPAAASRRTAGLGNLLVDGVLFASTIAAAPRFPTSAAFSAAVLILSMRLAAGSEARSPAAPAGDRIVVLSIVALAAAFGKFLPAIQGLALLALALGLFAQSHTAANDGLTTRR